jgi:hypothetical protein
MKRNPSESGTKNLADELAERRVRSGQGSASRRARNPAATSRKRSACQNSPRRLRRGYITSPSLRQRQQTQSLFADVRVLA